MAVSDESLKHGMKNYAMAVQNVLI